MSLIFTELLTWFLHFHYSVQQC